LITEIQIYDKQQGEGGDK